MQTNRTSFISMIAPGESQVLVLIMSLHRTQGVSSAFVWRTADLVVPPHSGYCTYPDAFAGEFLEDNETALPHLHRFHSHHKQYSVQASPMKRGEILKKRLPLQASAPQSTHRHLQWPAFAGCQGRMHHSQQVGDCRIHGDCGMPMRHAKRDSRYY